MEAINMEMRNCKKCGRVFAAGFGEKICLECKEKEDEMFTVVKDYIYDHPHATVKEISQETEVEEETILRYLREGRIEVAEDSLSLLTCEKCGKSIKSGKYCNECAAKLSNALNTALDNARAKNAYTGPIMHTQDLNR